MRLHYMDTDSMVMSLSKPIDELVLPGREQEWAVGKSKWFVVDPKCPDQKREPGGSNFILCLICPFLNFFPFNTFIKDC